ncbi:putative long-chain-fatty-acid- ligase protein [Neofusicoccum parvum]|uniref:Long-chain-fatty-acid- ligase protein n=1 Tax=Neofusicoccum parvum TaxID=310453 RepID=A0ACB5SHF5_9PEZI|nr:putative long-chain-fatty-acid- ligase protein [Neofusicoccum parvum]GME47664.1 putative long-chain-fatty-acid- ligase protein [Neofusicoccum parvum]
MASASPAVQRLHQTLQILDPAARPQGLQLSLVHGPVDPPLLNFTIGELLDFQADKYHDREALVVSWTGTRWTYGELKEQSLLLARGMLSMGIKPGDRIAIMAGNCEEYVAVFFAAARIGAILVVLNNTYTATEATYALNHTECKLLFIQSKIGRYDNGNLVEQLRSAESRLKTLPSLAHVVALRDEIPEFTSYDKLISLGSVISPYYLYRVSSTLNAHDVCNLQFTSGSTGNPKAAMLTHFNIVNNSRFIGDRMAFTYQDVLACPPPLFHCFGLVLGLMACITHGSKLVLPGEVFDAEATLRAISDEQCTGVHGVPAMFDSILSLPRPDGFDCSKLRTGIIAGAPVPRHLMEGILVELGMTEYTSSYGLTEASPTCFNAHTYDTVDRRLTTVGTILPHAHAKIVDRNNRILPVGQRGELCMAGYQLQRGYWNNVEKTEECMIRDEQGILWLHTGDEAVFDENGYCTITGRFKDIIIRGGENIYPLEIEERLVAHPSIERAIVVGLRHAKYGEVVGAFLERSPDKVRLSDDEVREWTRQLLGRHKAPAHIFWLGEDGLDASVPMTGSGKIKKYELRKLGDELVAAKGAEFVM